MPVFCARWQDGSFSIVSARDRTDAYVELDEMADDLAWSWPAKLWKIRSRVWNVRGGKAALLFMSRRYTAFSLFIYALAALSLPAAESSYRQVENWAQFPAGVQKWESATGVDVDARGNVYVLHRNPAMPIMVFDRSGKFLRAWGQGMFKTTHFLRVDRAGSVWVTDRGDMQAFQFSSEGKLLLTLGKKGVTGGNESQDTFNGMADVAVAKNGDVFVADGEGPNTRVARFSKEGQFIRWWGGKGTGPGQFNVPHSIAIDAKGLVYVADRSNDRIQVFDPNGKFLKQWTNFGTPWGLYIRKNRIYVVDGTANNCLLIADLKDGTVLDKIPGLSNPTAVTVDSAGAIYVAEVNGANVKKFVMKK